MDILHHGATRGVTGSCHELAVTDGERQRGLLIDCGLFQGDDTGNSAHAGNLTINFPISHLEALVVTHVHIDHVGRIPYLLAAGFGGPILCSEPSALLLPAMLEDAVKIGFTRNRQLIERFLDELQSRLVPIPYNHWHTVWASDESQVAIRLQRAGHILGSAYVECEVREGSRSRRVVFSGDLGAPEAPLLPEPVSTERADTLVIESTYGDRDHESRADRLHRLKAVLEHALEDGGTVLIPAFAIGRTQDILYELEAIIAEAESAGKVSGTDWQHLDIVVDSPLAADFTQLYERLKPFWDEEATERVRAGRDPLSFEQLTVVSDHKQHEQMVRLLARTHRPAVVLAGSGMCTGGRVVNYLKALLEDARNDVLFVGYQAAGTTGRELLNARGQPGRRVAIDGTDYPVHAQIHQLGGYSAHAGRSDLLRFVQGIPTPPEEIRIVHGDPVAKACLQKALGPAAWIP